MNASSRRAGVFLVVFPRTLVSVFSETLSLVKKSLSLEKNSLSFKKNSLSLEKNSLSLEKKILVFAFIHGNLMFKNLKLLT